MIYITIVLVMSVKRLTIKIFPFLPFQCGINKSDGKMNKKSTQPHMRYIKPYEKWKAEL